VTTILFLCVANSARSQMAEGLARAAAPDGYRFLSAGSEPGQLNPLAVAVLREDGVDISQHHAKGLDAIPLDDVDMIVTLCAEEVCPVAPGTVRRLHWPIPDPPNLTSFREARNRLKMLLPQLWEGDAQ